MMQHVEKLSDLFVQVAGEESKATKQDLQERLSIAERGAAEAREEAALAKAETKTWRAKLEKAQARPANLLQSLHLA